MRKIIPGVSVLAVVFPDRAPLPLAEIRSPLFPRYPGVTRVVQPLLFRYVHYFFCSHGGVASPYNDLRRGYRWVRRIFLSVRVACRNCAAVAADDTLNPHSNSERENGLIQICPWTLFTR